MLAEAAWQSLIAHAAAGMTLAMSAHKVTLLVYQRQDRKWSWHNMAGGNLIATDGGQGYENEADCQAMADAIAQGAYAHAERRRRGRPSEGEPPSLTG